MMKLWTPARAAKVYKNKTKGDHISNLPGERILNFLHPKYFHEH
jgi:hypothetical protein